MHWKINGRNNADTDTPIIIFNARRNILQPRVLFREWWWCLVVVVVVSGGAAAVSGGNMRLIEIASPICIGFAGVVRA